MSQSLSKFISAFFRTEVVSYRSSHGLTQEEMAEALQVSVCSYWSHEHGKHGFSCQSIACFLTLLSEEELIVCQKGLKLIVSEAEEKMVQ